MSEEALLLDDGRRSDAYGNVVKILRFFGVTWRSLSIGDFVAGVRQDQDRAPKGRLICTSDVFLKLIEDLGEKSIEFRAARLHSVFVFAGDDRGALERLVRRLSGDGTASILPIVNPWTVSSGSPHFSGPFSGVSMAARPAGNEVGFVFDKSKAVDGVLSAGSAVGLLKLEQQTVPVWLSSGSKIVDLDGELAARNFDIRDHVLSALPVVLYVKWAFPESCWKAPEVSACLVIDDPLLKSRYGFLKFGELLALMKKHKFSTNIAFIPWNWRRSDPEVVRMFSENPEAYSLSVHGCDHTAGEFGTVDAGRLGYKIRRATELMSRHKARTGIDHAQVMVFPQGVFSKAAMGALKRNNFVAAVNTEVLSVDPEPAPIRIVDTWDLAVTCYDCFPMFTRRYPTQGIENFAFDILLGKPCVIVIHHDFCCGQYKQLLSFIDILNGLNCAPSWRSLGEVVRRSCRQRELVSGVVETEMYANELRLENRSERSKRFLIRKRECDSSIVEEVHDGTQALTWRFSAGALSFETELSPGEIRTVRVVYNAPNDSVRSREGTWYEVKSMLRRHLSELRDNYITPTKYRFNRK